MTDFPARGDRHRVVMGGQSMNQVPVAPRDVPTRVAKVTGYVTDATPAHGGLGWNFLMLPQYLTELEAAVTTDRTILVMNGGQGDALEQVGRTAEDCYELAASYAALARGYGYWKVAGVAFPTIDDGFYGPIAFPPSLMVLWAEVQAITVADPDGIYDVVTRCDTAPFNDATNTTYFAVDELHLSANGAAIMGDRIAASVLTF